MLGSPTSTAALAARGRARGSRRRRIRTTAYRTRHHVPSLRYECMHPGAHIPTQSPPSWPHPRCRTPRRTPCRPTTPVCTRRALLAPRERRHITPYSRPCRSRTRRCCSRGRTPRRRATSSGSGQRTRRRQSGTPPATEFHHPEALIAPLDVDELPPPLALSLHVSWRRSCVRFPGAHTSPLLYSSCSPAPGPPRRAVRSCGKQSCHQGAAAAAAPRCATRLPGIVARRRQVQAAAATSNGSSCALCDTGDCGAEVVPPPPPPPPPDPPPPPPPPPFKCAWAPPGRGDSYDLGVLHSDA